MLTGKAPRANRNQSRARVHVVTGACKYERLLACVHVHSHRGGTDEGSTCVLTRGRCVGNGFPGKIPAIELTVKNAAAGSVRS